MGHIGAYVHNFLLYVNISYKNKNLKTAKIFCSINLRLARLYYTRVLTTYLYIMYIYVYILTYIHVYSIYVYVYTYV